MCLFKFALILSAASAQFSSREFNRNSDDEGCVCVPEHVCPRGVDGARGEGLLDIRVVKRYCANYFEVCCMNPDNNIATQKPPPLFPGCGYYNPLEVGYRITGDSSDANFGELPWTVMVFYKRHTSERNVYKCGGSLIHHHVVITAAHCVADNQEAEWVVRAGEWNTKSQDEPLPHQDRLVEEIVIHQHYRAGSLKNDIALLFLEEAIVMANNIGFICLPAPGAYKDASRCMASGWGKDAFKKGKHSSVLRKVDLPMVSRESCEKSLRSTRLGQFYNLHRSFICAGGEGNRDTCKGDGGSPLVCPIPGHPGRFLQMGIVSWGIGCGENNTPGVYANVALYRDWVDKQLGARSFDTSLYKYE